METLPNFFIVGAEKAGTSSLYEYLRKIPGIYMSPNKEPMYFSKNVFGEIGHRIRTIEDKKKYLKLFVNAKDEKIIGEASPGYLPNPEAPKLIHEVSPNARILISLRDPVERLFSQYLMTKRRGRIKTSFHDTLQDAFSQGIAYSESGQLYLRLFAGLYSKYVKSYLDIFGRKQVKIIIFEEWISDPKKTIEEILRFLGLNSSVNDLKNEVHNPFGVSRGRGATLIITNPQVKKIAYTILSTQTKKFLKEKLLIKKVPKPTLSKEDREILINYYREDVENLQSLLGRNLPWINF